VSAVPSLPYLDAGSIRELVPMADAIAALRRHFAGTSVHLPRERIPVAGGDLLVMPATDGALAGVKLVTVQPANAGTGRPLIQGLYVLIDGRTGAPVAMVDGAALTRLRTPAASAVVTDAMAVEDVRVLAVYGAGPQAEGHVEAMRIVRPSIEVVATVGRGGAFPVDAGIICCCTSSAGPLFAGHEVQPGTHLNVVGSYTTDRREVDLDTVRRSTVVVDDLAAAHEEAGDLVLAATEGWSWDHLAGDLHDVASGRLHRRDDAEITLFKSVGLAVQDLVVARLAAERAGLLEGD
jgi:ornithine cyclodeaminase/alanine dehydrogenase-like protein (mu-crystallin family)